MKKEYEKCIEKVDNEKMISQELLNGVMMIIL